MNVLLYILTLAVFLWALHMAEKITSPRNGEVEDIKKIEVENQRIEKQIKTCRIHINKKTT